jgi:hypothetical protein
MASIFGITVPWTTSNTEKEDVSTTAEDTKPSFPQNASTQCIDTCDTKHQSIEIPHTVSSSSQKQEPTSDSKVVARTREREASTESATSALNINRRRHPLGVTGLPSARASLRPPRPPTRRSVSSPSSDTQLQYGDTINIRIIEETDAATRGRDTGEQVSGVRRSRSARPVHPESRRSKIDIDSYSSPNLRQMRTSCQKPIQEKPLKTCLKQKANSTIPTPACETRKELTEPINRKLRRMKTVDFQKSKPLTCALPPIIACSQTGNSMATQAIESSAHNVQSPTTIRRTSTCPNTITTMKSSPADSAVTRTDVHVIAISPSLDWASKAVRLGQGTDPLNPTMQIVESGNGVYRIIWDNFPEDHNCGKNKCMPPADEATGNHSPTAVRGLERVNTKLTEWSGRLQSPSNSLNPTVAVYPGDYTHHHRLERVMDHAGDDGDVLAPPPNSTRTSAIPSRGQSHSASLSLSRENSGDELTPDSGFQKKPSESPATDPNQEVWSDCLVDARGRLQDEVATRSISHFYNNDTAFHDHRDSVAIAHDRLSRTRGTSRDMYTHRDSIALAKKRLHAKDRTTLGARNVTQSDVLDLEVRNDSGDLRYSNSQTRRPMWRKSPRSFS